MHRYWFRPKRYGYGPTPITWQGWALTLAIPVIVAASIIGVNRLAGRSDVIAWLVWATFMAVMMFWFVQIARQRTEGRWRWRWGASQRH